MTGVFEVIPFTLGESSRCDLYSSNKVGIPGVKNVVGSLGSFVYIYLRRVGTNADKA